ncbi:hypothetical protein [Staphylococcus hominis]|uniref:hypothetical protein n=1 Tax=Staphylococcus hominis TaxID=1290 RepID=UPI00287ADE93|nr:hypothetical protein [Staphylococcus hominis]MDS3836315.1 hypothetical protein [Staphylococcus hominis]
MAEVKLSQESYDELLKDIKALRLQADTYFEQWQDAKRKAEAWDKQKDELREMVTFGCHFEEDTPSKYMNVAYRIVLKIMCELDGTNDFKNLSSDLERGSDE